MSFFLDAQKEAKEAPGESSKWALRAHIRLPLDTITGDAPLVQWCAEHNYLKAPAEAVRKEALHLHVNRIFDDPRWVDFVPFNRRYRPEALEHAHLVKIINSCCEQPGEVTQEQIDASDNGTVACPCCGRWSPFRVLEQAIQTESAAGQTEEAKGGMHLC